MKKYWKLSLLTIFIIIAFTVFYMGAGTVSNSFAQLEVQKIEGDEKAVKDLSINGHLFTGMIGESFRVDQQGTSYLRDESFIKRLRGYYQDVKIEHLQKDYRGFMRGKQENSDYYFEDEDILAYGAIPYNLLSYENYTFEIAVLDKQTGDEVSFTLPVPNRGDYWYVEPHGVFVDGNELSLVTVNDILNNNEMEETSVHIYTFDLGKEQLINEEVIDSLNSAVTENGHHSIDILINEKSEDGQLFIIESLVEYID